MHGGRFADGVAPSQERRAHYGTSAGPAPVLDLMVLGSLRACLGRACFLRTPRARGIDGGAIRKDVSRVRAAHFDPRACQLYVDAIAPACPNQIVGSNRLIAVSR